RRIASCMRCRIRLAGDEVKGSHAQFVTVAVAQQTAREPAQEAVKLRDQGRYEEAARLFQQNVDEIRTAQSALAAPSPILDRLGGQYSAFSKSTTAVQGSQWLMDRKLLRQMDGGSVSGGAR